YGARHMRMLIIDDSQTMRRFLRSIADELAIESDQASDGEEALQKLELTGSFEVALVDWDMPRMNGIEFARVVRSRPEYADMKLMMVTSHNAMSDLRVAAAVGVDDFLMKPLNAEMLAGKLRLLGLID